MNSSRWMIAGVVLCGLVAGAPQCVAASDVVRDACASTPAAALVAAKSAGGSNAYALGEAHGYRVASVRWDALQRQNWAVIASCDHPDRPSMTLLMNLPASPMALNAPAAHSFATVPMVRAGDVVRLWRNDHYAHIEMIATSEENGAVGSRVRVRLAAPGLGEGQSTQPLYFAGVVRGPADVEMEP